MRESHPSGKLHDFYGRIDDGIVVPFRNEVCRIKFSSNRIERLKSAWGHDGIVEAVISLQLFEAADVVEKRDVQGQSSVLSGEAESFSDQPGSVCYAVGMYDFQPDFLVFRVILL